VETFNNSSQTFGIFTGKQQKAVPTMADFVHPPQKHKFLFDMFLRERRFYEADKTEQPGFYLSKIVFLLSKIVYISISYTSNEYATFVAGKIYKK
jgi:hypothetical protein